MSGKFFNDEQSLNISLIFLILFVFQLEMPLMSINEEHL